MNNSLFNLRWFLLDNIVNIDNIIRWHRLSFTLSFLLFFLSSSTIFLVKYSRFLQKRTYLLSDWIFLISLIGFLVIGRWPGLLLPMQNPDEAQFIAGAMKLWKDPLFWHSVESGSSGPLNIYPLMLPALFGLRIEYASARIVGLVLVLVTIIGLYYSLQLIYNKTIARVAIFPVVISFTTMRYFDYIHYSSEHIPMAILSLALVTICYHYSRPSIDTRLVALSGFLLGLLPYAKFQAVPIGFCLAILSIHVLGLKSATKLQFFRGLTAFILASLSGTVLIILYLLSFSLFDDFWKSYIQQNLLFYSTSFAHQPDRGWFFSLIQPIWIRWIFLPEATRFLFGLTLLTLVFVFPILGMFSLSESTRLSRTKTFFFSFYGLAMLLATYYAITKPGTGYAHYLLFLLMPSGFFLGTCLGELQSLILNLQAKISYRRFLIVLFTALILSFGVGGTIQTMQTVRSDNPFLARRKLLLANYQTPLEKAILKYIKPGEPMVIWGWANELHVGTGTIPGVRDGSIVWILHPSSLQSYYSQRYIKDMLESKAPVFVDAVAPKMFRYKNREKEGHEAFPEIATIVRDKYRLVEEIDGVRIYTRR